jgi:hypothetical protein
LNHSNICTLHDGGNYLVMADVEGRDLRGPQDLNAALPIIEHSWTASNIEDCVQEIASDRCAKLWKRIEKRT